MTEHLPDCDDYAFSGLGFHPNCERICICRQVKRIEKRVLDATQQHIMRLPYEIDGEIWIDRDEVLGWIEKLRGEQ